MWWDRAGTARHSQGTEGEKHPAPESDVFGDASSTRGRQEGISSRAWDPVGSPALVPRQQLRAPRAIPRGLRGRAGWAQGEDTEGSRGKVKHEGPAPPAPGKPSLKGEDGAAELGGAFWGSQGHFSERARSGTVSRQACRSAATHGTAPVIPVPPKPAWLQEPPLSPCIGNGGGGSRKRCFSHPTPPRETPARSHGEGGAAEGEMGKGGQSRARPRASDKQRGKLGQV